ncbi:MAG: hypothetical protein ACW99G_01560 [Candidatus Thorarchaeota archaeon]|jgi:hypothetical protein
MSGVETSQVSSIPPLMYLEWRYKMQLNGIKDDNRIENLLLLDNNSHSNYIPALKNRIKELEKTILELRNNK